MKEYLSAKHRPYVLFAAFYAAICLAGVALVFSASDRLLTSFAMMEAQEWTRNLGFSLKNLPQIAQGNRPDGAAAQTLEQARHLGHVTEFGIYDVNGHLQYKSSESANSGPFTTTIAGKLPEFREEFARGIAAVTAQDGRFGGRAGYYTIALAPVMDGGNNVGWLEIITDQTARRELFFTATATVAGIIGLLLALGPAIGFWYRSRQKKRAELELAYYSRHDSLTGLLNRSAWLTAVEEHIAKEEASAGTAAMMHIHLSGVASANSIHGNLAGDHLLRIAAERFREIAPHNALFARITGDKFGLLLSGVDAIAAARTAKAIMASAAQSSDWQGHSLSTPVCIGIALFPHDGKDQSSLSKGAELSLNLARESGVAGYRFFDSSIEAKAAKQRELERIVAEACDNNWLELHFQPVYELRSGKLSGFEALVRLKHPQRGNISPGEFIPVAERTGEIERIGAWCLEEACTIAANWPPEITVSVNLSPLQFDSGSLIGTLRRVFEKTRFPAYQLELEITEGLLLGDSEIIRTQLAAMSDMGIRIVLDDFGTGYSSFNYLWKFPFAKIKIDQSFIRVMEENASVLGIVRTIILLGRSLGLPVTAEGIETPSQAALLRRLRCDLGQGYLFSRPVPVTDVARLIMSYYAEALKLPAAAPPADIAVLPPPAERAAG